MQEQPKTSFVPKKPISIQANQPVSTRRKAGLDLFSIISFIVLFISLSLWGIAWLWKSSVASHINRQVAELKAINSKFDRNFVDSAVRLNDRIVATENLIDNHVAPSQIFTMLEENTLRSVSFTAFNFSYTEDGLLKISGEGVADSFESVVLQSDQFGKNRALSNVLFYGLQRNEEDQTEFSFDSVLNPEFISYSRLIYGDSTLLNNESLELQTTGSIFQNLQRTSVAEDEPVDSLDSEVYEDDLGPFGDN